MSEHNITQHTYGIGIYNDTSAFDIGDTVLGSCVVAVENTDMIKDGATITIPEQYQSETPIHIRLYPEMYAKGTCSIVVKKGAHVVLIESLQAKKHLLLDVVIEIEPGAVVTYVVDQTGTSAESVQYVTRTCTLQEGASLVFFDLYERGRMIQSRLHVSLLGKQSSTTIYGLCQGTADQVFDIHHTIEHCAPSTTSNILTKGVLADESKTIYLGNIHIHESMTDSHGSQRADVLLLSDKAEIDVVPHLNIEHHTVVCSHAVTISHLNPENIFYAQSRGLDEQTATQMMIAGYVDEIKHKLPVW